MLFAADRAPYFIPALFTFAGVVVTVTGGIITLVISNGRIQAKGDKVVAAVSEWEIRWEERGRMIQGYQVDLEAAIAREERCQERLAAVEHRLDELETSGHGR